MAQPLSLLLYRAAAAVSEPLWRFGLRRRVAAGREDPARLAEKFGHPGAPRPPGRLVWFHALSVGEVLALMTLLRHLLARRPGLHVLLTTSTRASAEALDRVGLPDRVIHQYAPVDAPGPLRRFLAHWRPEAAVFAEFDLWPLRVLATDAAGIPMILINSRVNEQRFRRRQRGAATYGNLLRRFRAILLQDAESVPRFRALGAPEPAISVMGVLKSAADPLPDAPETRTALAAAMGDRPRWLAAATERREEAQVFAAHRRALRDRPDLLLVIAPRQIKHADETDRLARSSFAHVARRSRSEPLTSDTEVYVADTIGEMGLWYRLCPLAFVGHSLPVEGERLTGKNPYEAAALHSMVLHGPCTEHFAESYAALHAEGGARQVGDAEALAAAVLAALDPATRAPAIAGADRVMAAGKAPLDAALAAVLALLPETAPPSPDRAPQS